MATDTTDPRDGTPNDGGDAFYRRVAEDLEHLRTQLSDLDTRRRRSIEDEEQRRADHVAGLDRVRPGIPE